MPRRGRGWVGVFAVEVKAKSAVPSWTGELRRRRFATRLCGTAAHFQFQGCCRLRRICTRRSLAAGRDRCGGPVAALGRGKRRPASSCGSRPVGMWKVIAGPGGFNGRDLAGARMGRAPASIGEEVLTRADATGRRQLANVLAAAVNAGVVRVVTTMRSEFLDPLLASGEFAELPVRSSRCAPSTQACFPGSSKPRCGWLAYGSPQSW